VKACGEVTSCTRCKSMYKTAGEFGCWETTCESQIFWNNVFGIVLKPFTAKNAKILNKNFVNLARLAVS
jgi:hypothetical protein